MQGVWSKLAFPLYSVQHSHHLPCKDLQRCVTGKGVGILCDNLSRLEEDIFRSGLPWEVGVGDFFLVLELPLAEVALERRLPSTPLPRPDWKIQVFFSSFHALRAH